MPSSDHYLSMFLSCMTLQPVLSRVSEKWWLRLLTTYDWAPETFGGRPYSRVIYATMSVEVPSALEAKPLAIRFQTRKRLRVYRQVFAFRESECARSTYIRKGRLTLVVIDFVLDGGSMGSRSSDDHFELVILYECFVMVNLADQVSLRM